MRIVRSFILSVALTATFLTGSSHASDGEAAFKAQCAACHGPRDIAFWGKQYPDADARQAWLDQFLRRHYPPPDAERVAIVGYIQRVIAAEGATR